ncbi:uncharacterized protein conserved in bacteria [Hahella chejuensis KCTC 2396]|uniref:Inner membrane protein n=1 Tax=Hahella chejuensis (strain KCTC 2396) TaxID=349521 RepID=Q2SE13_HAHCH|nr:YbaN family protein [Hahella chejuensis]ABC31111.1 uncharacterized protein conserved in bacteria [Hahella chejuensis KCTC 2396]
MRKQSLHILLVVVGWTSVVLGVIGIVLPLLPTTPFILLAAACFARSSPKFHHWLVSHRHLGPIVKNFESGRGVTRKVRARALICLWVGLSISMVVVGKLWSLIMLSGIGACTTLYLCRLPTYEEDAGEPESQVN